MTKYTVAIKDDGEATARNTTDLDAALDWYTNACTEVMADESSLTFASLAVEGVVWALIQEGGLPPSGDIIELKKVA